MSQREHARLDEELLDEEGPMENATPGGGFADALEENFGSTPWWVISGAFHALVILLTILVSLAILKQNRRDDIVTMTLDKIKPPTYDEIVKRDIVNQQVVFESELPPVDQPVEVLVEVEVAPIETDDLSELAESRGEVDMISNVPLQSYSTSRAIGAGSAGAGLLGNRSQGRRTAGLRGACKASEQSVEAALRWLAKHQEPDGRWDTQKYGAGAKTDTACTGLALLAFLGAGHTEKIGKYKENVQRAVSWLKSVQSPEGCIYAAGDGGTSGPGYAHSIAGMALAEATGMGGLPDTRRAAQLAMDYSCRIHGETKGDGNAYGGGGPWRYQPGQAGDTSVTGWFVMQLKSGKISGLEVPAGSFDAAIRFLDTVEKRKGAANDPYSPSTYWYTTTRELGHGGSHHRLSSIGNLSRQFLGWKKEDLEASINNFVQDGGLPDWGKCDLYYWYYGTLCVFQQGGALWERWNGAMKQALLPNQKVGGDEDGSWDPTGHFAEKWGRVGQTALSCLCLEVYYRYAPLYRN